MTPVATQTTLGHLKALRNDLTALRDHLDPDYRPLFDAGQTAADTMLHAGTEFADGLGTTQDLNKTLILALMDFTLKWEVWLDSGVRFRYAASLVFHRLLLRAVKGAIKRWRLWRVDLAGQ